MLHHDSNNDLCACRCLLSTVRHIPGYSPGPQSTCQFHSVASLDNAVSYSVACAVLDMPGAAPVPLLW